MVTDPCMQLLGYVHDFAAVYGCVRPAIPPLRSGAVTKRKALEAVAAGLACVVTPVAAEGLPLPVSLKDAVAGDAASMAGLIWRLHADADRSAPSGQAGLAMLHQVFRERPTTVTVAKALDRTLNRGSTRSDSETIVARLGERRAIVSCQAL
jgi:Glycosyl transferases group 1